MGNDRVPFFNIERALCSVGFVAFLAYFGLHCFRYTWYYDFRSYVGAVHSLYQNLADPPHEAMSVSGKYSLWFTPYFVLIAVLGRAMGVSPYRALQVAGLFNLSFYLAALLLFFRQFSRFPRSWLPPLIFLVVSLFLRSRVYFWSSETSFASLRLIAAYPSMFAWATAIASFGLADQYLRGARSVSRERIQLFLIGSATWVVMLSHLLTASWMMEILAVLDLYRLATATPDDRKSVFRRSIMLACAVCAGAALTLAWPYFNIVENFILVSVPENAPFGSEPFGSMTGLYALAVIALLFFLRWRSHGFLVVGFLATLMAYALFRFVNLPYGDRYVFFQAFFAQAAVAEIASFGILHLFDRTFRPQAERVVAGVFAAVMVILIAVAPTGKDMERAPVLSLKELLTGPSSHDLYYHHFDALKPFLDARDMVLSHLEPDALDVTTLTGARVVISPYSYHVPDYAERVSDLERFFRSDSTRGERDRIIDHYGITKILLIGEHRNLGPQVTAWFGPPIASTQTTLLYRTRGDTL